MIALVSVAIASDMSPSVVGQITRSSPYVYVAHDGGVVAARSGMSLRIGDWIFTRPGGSAAYTVGHCQQQIGETAIATIVSAMTSGQPCIVTTQTFASAQDFTGLPGSAAGGSAAGAPAAGGAAAGAGAGAAAGGTAVAVGATAGAVGSGLSSITMLFGGIAGAAASVAGATLGGGSKGNESGAAVATPEPVANPVAPTPQTPSSVPDPVQVPQSEFEPTPVSA